MHVKVRFTWLYMIFKGSLGFGIVVSQREPYRSCSQIDCQNRKRGHESVKIPTDLLTWLLMRLIERLAHILSLFT